MTKRVDDAEQEPYESVQAEIYHFAEQMVPENVHLIPVKLAHHFWLITDAAGLDPRQVMQELEDVTLRNDRHRAAIYELREVVARHEVEREAVEEKLRLASAA